jgi:hypothetical protein
LENKHPHQDTASTQNKTHRKRKTAFLILLIILLLLLIWFLFFRNKQTEPLPVPARDTISAVPDDSGMAVDTEEVVPSVDSVVFEDTVSDNIDTVRTVVPVKPVVKDTIMDTVAPVDSAAVYDSTGAIEDSVESADDACAKDTSALWVYPDPSGGLHYDLVSVRFIANREAKVHYRMKGDSTWRVYASKPVTISTTTTLYFDAIDSCGRVMERREEYYEIEKGRSESPCDKGMEYISVGEMHFCMDRYEWPNRQGIRPQAYISYYQAMDSCFSVDKRLCSVEEWTVACGGAYSYSYPYGNTYEPYGCVTHDTLVEPSGSKPECRSFFGVFDMSGNLLEWTSTKARENSAFYYVTGGFWESGPKSGCKSRRYSYYPQNRHNPVGFRCCKDIASTATSKGNR